MHFSWPMLHIFGASYSTKCPGDQILIGHSVEIMMIQFEQIGHHTCRKQNPGCEQNKKFTFILLLISPGTAATEWFLIMKLFLVQLYSLQLQSMTHFDPVLCMHMVAYSSQSMLFLQTGCTCQDVCILF